MDYERDTFVFFLSKNKQDFFIKMLYILCSYFLTVEKSFKDKSNLYLLKLN